MIENEYILVVNIVILEKLLLIVCGISGFFIVRITFYVIVKRIRYCFFVMNFEYFLLLFDIEGIREFVFSYIIIKYFKMFIF